MVILIRPIHYCWADNNNKKKGQNYTQRDHFDDFDLVGTLCGADNNN
jgi:hypothetical protein